MSVLLALIITVLTVLPLVTFAADLPNSRLLRDAREQVAARSGRRFREENPEVRRTQLRLRREQLGTTPTRAVMAMGVQLFFLVAAGVIGRRVFALRL